LSDVIDGYGTLMETVQRTFDECYGTLMNLQDFWGFWKKKYL